MPAAVIFDLDGVLLDSEHLWNAAKRAFTEEAGGRWLAEADRAMMGMSSPEWSEYMRSSLGIPLPAAEINREVLARMDRQYREQLPLFPGATEVVHAIAAVWPVALASSANREIIDLVAEVTGLAASFAATVSSEEVPRGKPAPDVYLEAARRLDADPRRCIAIEDSSNGVRAAAAAGMAVIAVPNEHYPPDADALALAAASVATIAEVTPSLIRSALA